MNQAIEYEMLLLILRITLALVIDVNGEHELISSFKKH